MDYFSDPGFRHQVPLEINVTRERHLDVESLVLGRHKLLNRVSVMLGDGIHEDVVAHAVRLQLLILFRENRRPF